MKRSAHTSNTGPSSNSCEEIFKDNAIYTFTHGVRRFELKEALGRLKPKTISHLMQIANEWADGEDSVRNERQGTPEDEPDIWGRKDSHNSDRRRKHKVRQYDDAKEADFVAAGFPDNHAGRSRDNSRQNDGGREGGYRQDVDRKRA